MKNIHKVLRHATISNHFTCLNRSAISHLPFAAKMLFLLHIPQMFCDFTLLSPHPFSAWLCCRSRFIFAADIPFLAPVLQHTLTSSSDVVSRSPSLPPKRHLYSKQEFQWSLGHFAPFALDHTYCALLQKWRLNTCQSPLLQILLCSLVLLLELTEIRQTVATHTQKNKLEKIPFELALELRFKWVNKVRR